jgi:hypothetical protein
MRYFETGATRSSDEGKLDFEGFLHPLFIQRFAEYMHKHRKQEDGKLRASDNWQKGMPKESFMKSGWRHFFDWWKQHRGWKGNDTLEDSICALVFNCQGYLVSILKERGYQEWVDQKDQKTNQKSESTSLDHLKEELVPTPEILSCSVGFARSGQWKETSVPTVENLGANW